MIELETEFIQGIREIQTLNDSVSVYENADISIREFNPDEVYPTALYVVNSHLEKVREVGSMFWNNGINIYQLDEVVELNGITIAPPIIELSDGVPAIVDGIHRFYLARQLGFNVSCIYIENPSLPIVSYPVNWNEVTRYDISPENAEQRRRLRNGINDTSEDLRRYYRDFSVFGSRGRRPRLGQDG